MIEFNSDPIIINCDHCGRIRDINPLDVQNAGYNTDEDTDILMYVVEYTNVEVSFNDSNHTTYCDPECRQNGIENE